MLEWTEKNKKEAGDGKPMSYLIFSCFTHALQFEIFNEISNSKSARICSFFEAAAVVVPTHPSTYLLQGATFCQFQHLQNSKGDDDDEIFLGDDAPPSARKILLLF